MVRRSSCLALAAVAVLVLSWDAEAAPRHEREGHKEVAGEKLTARFPSIPEQLKKEFGSYKLLGYYREAEEKEVEAVIVTAKGQVVEVVFKQTLPNAWSLIGFEVRVPVNKLPLPARNKLLMTKPGFTIVEVEEVTNAKWKFLGFQVTLQKGATRAEVFIDASGTIIPDPL